MPTALGIVEFLSQTNAPATLGMEPLAGRMLAGQPLVQWIARRVSQCQQLERVIVLCDTAVIGPELEALIPSDIPLVRCRAGDALSGYRQALEAFPCQSVVRVGGHEPLVDPTLIDRLVTAAGHGSPDYVGYISRHCQPALAAPIGMLAQWCTADALRQADREATTLAERGAPLPFICGRPELFALKLIPVPAELDLADMRLSIHSEDDWDTIQELMEAQGAEGLDWQSVASLLAEQPVLRQRMARLNRAVAARSR